MNPMRRLAPLVLAAIVASGCATGTDLSANARQAVESGTSFGMCGGYCETQLVVDGSQATLIEMARNRELPDRSRTIELSAAEQSRFYAAVDTAAVRRLAGVHGCPDCADGGAEWIEVGDARVTFDFGKELAGIAPLQREIRALRARFPR